MGCFSTAWITRRGRSQEIRSTNWEVDPTLQHWPAQLRLVSGRCRSQLLTESRRCSNQRKPNTACWRKMHIQRIGVWNSVRLKRSYNVLFSHITLWHCIECQGTEWVDSPNQKVEKPGTAAPKKGKADLLKRCQSDLCDLYRPKPGKVCLAAFGNHPLLSQVMPGLAGSKANATSYFLTERLGLLQAWSLVRTAMQGGSRSKE